MISPTAPQATRSPSDRHGNVVAGTYAHVATFTNGATGSHDAMLPSQLGSDSIGTKTPEMNYSGSTTTLASGGAASLDGVSAASIMPRHENAMAPIRTLATSHGR